MKSQHYPFDYLSHLANEQPKTFPDYFEEGKQIFADDVLIDVNGKREDFALGYFFPQHGWTLHETDLTLDLENMRWFYLPLTKYDLVN